MIPEAIDLKIGIEAGMNKTKITIHKMFLLIKSINKTTNPIKIPIETKVAIGSGKILIN